MSLFDAYLMVDWSAAARPVTGNDSIWLCLLRRRGGRLQRVALDNLATRTAARARIEALLGRVVADGGRVLASFDFPNAYPRGFARAAGFRPADWRGVWRGLSKLVADGPDNANNRFAAAGALNARISGDRYPFWGHHPAHAFDGLGTHRPPAPASALPQRRLCERFVPRAKTCWQLYGNGSVGGQTLLGIPVQQALRHASGLAGACRVWPFETGLAAPGPAARLVIAEVYPSLLFPRPPKQDRDRWQVLQVARLLARRDASGALARDFAGPSGFGTAERRLVEREEGWILGAGTFDPADPDGAQWPAGGACG